MTRARLTSSATFAALALMGCAPLDGTRETRESLASHEAALWSPSAAPLFRQLHFACIDATGTGLATDGGCACTDDLFARTFVMQGTKGSCVAATVGTGVAPCRGIDGRYRRLPRTGAGLGDVAALEACMRGAITMRAAVAFGTGVSFSPPAAGDPDLVARTDELLAWADANLVPNQSVGVRVWESLMSGDELVVHVGRASQAVLDVAVRDAIAPDYRAHAGLVGSLQTHAFEPNGRDLDSALGVFDPVASTVLRLTPPPPAGTDDEAKRRADLYTAFTRVVRDASTAITFTGGRALATESAGCAGACVTTSDWTSLGSGLEVMEERLYAHGSIARDALWVRRADRFVGLVVLGPARLPAHVLSFDAQIDEASTRFRVRSYDRAWNALGTTDFTGAFPFARLRPWLTEGRHIAAAQAVGLCEPQASDLVANDALLARVALGPNGATFQNGLLARGSFFGWLPNAVGDADDFGLGAEARFSVVPVYRGEWLEPGHTAVVAGAVLAGNPDAKLLPLGERACGDAFDAWYPSMRASGAPMRVVNSSFAEVRFGDDCFTGFGAHIRATESELLWVSAAGNNGAGAGSGGVEWPQSLCPQRLAGWVNHVIVAASEGDALGAYSNWGATFADLAAPGTFVDATGAHQGTSFAAPRVAGVAARIAMDHPALAPSWIRLALLASARITPQLRDAVRSGGALDASAARATASCFASRIAAAPSLAPSPALVRACLAESGFPGSVDAKLAVLSQHGIFF